MKKSIFFIVLAVTVGGLLAAQNRNPWGGPDPRWQAAPLETLKVTGKLGILEGMIALQDKDISYYVLGIERFIGFIEGLKEGATVTIEGYSRSSPSGDFRFLRATKLTLNNKEYDLVPSEQRLSQVRPDFAYPSPRRGKSTWHCRRGY
ncbi:MAG: hypothetical protein LBB80_00600 [Treponema sp.]|jgi:hypothetical protein|nr:hypothetical protein [Treponema sp.]